MNNNAMIKLKDVSFSYNSVPVLENVSLEIGEKDYLAIIGPNGGGKTTLLKLILGLLFPDKGEITIFGKPPKMGRKVIGYMPQMFEFDFSFPITVFEVVLMGRLAAKKMGKGYSKKDKEIAHAALEKVGMSALKDRNIGELSGGQRQRVLIARALAMQPKVLLLDEPAASVDHKWQVEFYQLLNQLNKDIAIVMVTHDVSVISTYVDKLACVNRKLYYHGSTKEGIHTISEMYHCPMEIAVHEVPHRLFGDHNHD